MPYLNEAVLLVAEGMKIKQIDKVMRRFGMPMGPLELLDQIGLDVAAHVARSLGPLLEGRFGANPAFEKMRERGWLGQKSGRGFYTHRGRSHTPNHLAENLLRAEAPGAAPRLARRCRRRRAAEARERLVLLMVNEAAMAFGRRLGRIGRGHRPGDGAGHGLGAAPWRAAALRRRTRLDCRGGSARRAGGAPWPALRPVPGVEEAGGIRRAFHATGAGCVRFVEQLGG